MVRGLHLLVADRQGVYIPQSFAENNSYEWLGLLDEDIRILNSGPDHPEYWDAWNDVIGSAFLIDTQGNKWHLWQDGDLWAVCSDILSDEEYANFFGEERV